MLCCNDSDKVLCLVICRQTQKNNSILNHELVNAWVNILSINHVMFLSLIQGCLCDIYDHGIINRHSMYMQLTCTSINCDTMCTMIEDIPVYIDDFMWRLMNSNV